jgi:hypothetical protein
VSEVSWNEVRERALAYSSEWRGAKNESAESQTFWNEFFQLFGLRRRAVASFEEPVRGISGRYGFIDLFWKGVVLVEHKSAGKSLDAAESQAFEYIQDLAREGRGDEIPRFVIVSDFARVALYDLEPPEGETLPLFAGRPYSVLTFPLEELSRNVRHFAFLRGERSVKLNPEDPANRKAYELMCRLHDAVEASGYTEPDLEKLLVRILFCLFAEDTGIFEPNAFQSFVRANTRGDGSDLGARLNELFEILNTEPSRRAPALSDELAALPYVNGGLFLDRLGFATFTRSMRDSLLEACEFHWARISPAVFGSLFQGVMKPAERRQVGAHYTTEPNILKVLRSLFLDRLHEELEQIKADRSTRRRARLEEFQASLRRLRILDPACGCGNFLVLAYRELRLLEMQLITALQNDAPQQVLDIRSLLRVDVDQFYGIEIGEWPTRIAEVAMWLMDHQMNQHASERFGHSYQRLPLRTTPHITHANALRLDWDSVIAASECTHILGNPPFVGKKARNEEQRQDMAIIWDGVSSAGTLDYVTCWYRKALQYANGRHIPIAFVSTNSITQGEQAGILWQECFGRWHAKIHFAHRTFAWQSEATGAAHVHVVIVGIGAYDVPHKYIVDYDEASERPTVVPVTNISPYLVEGRDTALSNRGHPLSNTPEMTYGNMPNDDGNFLLTEEGRTELVVAEPGATEFIRRFVSAKEYFSGERRWCLWLQGADPARLRQLPEVLRRVEAVRAYRLVSKREATRRLADTPSLFGEIRQPTTEFILVPRHSSERRKYVPFGYCGPEEIVADSCAAIPNATMYHLGVISSSMHMAWMRAVCGRIKSDYRYSSELVYNNFPWPEHPSSTVVTRIEDAARAIVAARSPFLPPHGEASLADLYDPLTMPSALLRTHEALDRAVERAYRPEQFGSDRERVEFLFAIHERLSAPLLPPETPRGSRRVRRTVRPRP